MMEVEQTTVAAPAPAVMGRVNVRAFENKDAERWEAYVASSPQTTFFHRIAWREICESVFRHRPHYLLAERGAEIAGVLPLVEVRSWLFGHALISLPFCVYGGPAADGREVAGARAVPVEDRARTRRRQLVPPIRRLTGAFNPL